MRQEEGSRLDQQQARGAIMRRSYRLRPPPPPAPDPCPPARLDPHRYAPASVEEADYERHGGGNRRDPFDEHLPPNPGGA